MNAGWYFSRVPSKSLVVGTGFSTRAAERSMSFVCTQHYVRELAFWGSRSWALTYNKHGKDLGIIFLESYNTFLARAPTVATGSLKELRRLTYRELRDVELDLIGSGANKDFDRALREIVPGFMGQLWIKNQYSLEAYEDNFAFLENDLVLDDGAILRIVLWSFACGIFASWIWSCKLLVDVVYLISEKMSRTWALNRR